jgi:hypothetical protein
MSAQATSRTGAFTPEATESETPVDEAKAARITKRITGKGGLLDKKREAGAETPGITFSYQRGREQKHGVSVSLWPDRTEKVSKDDIKTALPAFITKNSDLLNDPRYSLGVWDDGKGTIWLDVSTVVHDPALAEFAGRKYNQMGAFDMNENNAGRNGFIDTGGTGEPPSNMLPAGERLDALNKEWDEKNSELGPVTQARPEEPAPVPRDRPRSPKESEALSLDHVLNSPDMTKYASAIVDKFKTSVPGFEDIDDNDPHAALKEISSRLQDNVRFWWDRATPSERAEWRKWYDYANSMSKRWAGDFDTNWHQVAAVNAILSPQTPWDMNVTLTRNVLTTLKEDPTMTSKEKKFMSEAIKSYLDKKKPEDRNTAEMKKLKEDTDAMKPGMKLSDMNDTQGGVFLRIHQQATGKMLDTHDHNLEPTKGEDKKTAWMIDWPDLSKVVSVWRDGSMKNINDKLGWNHKVRSFYNNHVAPEDPRWTTIDTHAVAAATMLPVGSTDDAVVNAFNNPNHKASGYNGTYVVYQDAYQKVAKQLGVLPREVQSVVWEKARRTLTDVGKRSLQEQPELTAAIRAEVKSGKITPAEGRTQIAELYREHSKLGEVEGSEESQPSENEPF